MADRHRAARHQQFQRHRAPDDVRLPDDYGVLADQVFASVAQQDHAAVWRARTQPRPFQDQAAEVVRMKGVDVLVGMNALGDLVDMDMLGQRQLHENALHHWVGIKAIDEREQFRLRGRGGQVERQRSHADVVGDLALVAHVDHRRRVLTDEDDGEPRRGLARC